MFEFVLMVFLGLLLLYLGFRVWKKEEITLIISHHHQKVSEEDKKGYTEEIGKALSFVGTGMILTGSINFITNTVYGWLVFTIFFILGYMKMFKTQKKYNGGIF